MLPGNFNEHPSKLGSTENNSGKSRVHPSKLGSTGSARYIVTLISPQATRAPASPEGWLV
jgi:hypothetical protein